MVRYKDMTGERYGMLTAIEYVGKDKFNNALWRCKCDCGNEIEVSTTDLVSGHTRSCGCLMRETSAKTLTTHGKSKERLYIVWKGMLGRCNRPSSKYYKYYGGRGIKVCDEWANNYEAFREWAYANGYDENAKFGQCTIDRINVNGNYEPNNCRWADAKTQALNKRPRKRGYKRGSYKRRTMAIV